jgi:hypothetical protein
MNERIRELAISSGIYDSLCDPYDSHNTGDAHGSVMDDLEKFAELIVRECINICENQDFPKNPDLFQHGWDGGLQNAQERMMNHFGVES